jgi:L-fuconolactonase
MLKIIDPHIHLFDLKLGNYQWLKPENPPFWSDKAKINHNFKFSDLVLNNSLELVGAVHIEAGFNNTSPEKELAWLESQYKSELKTIAGIDLLLSESKFAEQLATVSTYTSCVGCRHILDEDAVDLLSNTQVRKNLALLNKYRWIFETQLNLSDCAAIDLLVTVITENPKTTFVINHAGFPNIGNNNELWLSSLKRLATLENIAIKCSGLEMVDRRYSGKDIEVTVETLINIIGVNRVIMASNFPLTLFSYSYQEYWELVLEAVPQEHHQSLCYNNAARIYRF